MSTTPKGSRARASMTMLAGIMGALAPVATVAPNASAPHHQLFVDACK